MKYQDTEEGQRCGSWAGGGKRSSEENPPQTPHRPRPLLHLLQGSALYWVLSAPWWSRAPMQGVLKLYILKLYNVRDFPGGPVAKIPGPGGPDSISGQETRSHRWQLDHWKRPWCWEGLRAGGEGDNTGWDGWMASPTQWTWVWVNSGSSWWTERPDVLWFMGSQSRTRLSNWTELNWYSASFFF